jgi:hypothetical protein
MLDYKTQSQLVDATAAMLRSYIAASTNTLAASAWRGLSLWAEMMGASATGGRPTAATAHTLWPSMANWMTAPQLYAWPAWPWPAPGRSVSIPFAPFTRTWLGPSFSMWTQVPDWEMWSRTSLPMWNGWLAPRATATATTATRTAPAASQAAPQPPPPYASYRSAGGHATAQVVVPDFVPVAEIAEVTATVVMSPMQTMLGAWRAALGVR